MSAVVAGKSCKKCGKEYYVSFGHPKWFDERDFECDAAKKFLAFQESGKCYNCYFVDNQEIQPSKEQSG